jgi:hypothetical protein
VLVCSVHIAAATTVLVQLGRMNPLMPQSAPESLRQADRVLRSGAMTRATTDSITTAGAQDGDR